MLIAYSIAVTTASVAAGDVTHNTQSVGDVMTNDVNIIMTSRRCTHTHTDRTMTESSEHIISSVHDDDLVEIMTTNF